MASTMDMVAGANLKVVCGRFGHNWFHYTLDFGNEQKQRRRKCVRCGFREDIEDADVPEQAEEAK